MVDLGLLAVNASTTLPLLVDQLSLTLQWFFGVLSALLGGLFGLYFLFFLLRFFYDRKVLREVRLLRGEVVELRKQLGRKKK